MGRVQATIILRRSILEVVSLQLSHSSETMGTAIGIYIYIYIFINVYMLVSDPHQSKERLQSLQK